MDEFAGALFPGVAPGATACGQAPAMAACCALLRRRLEFDQQGSTQSRHLEADNPAEHAGHEPIDRRRSSRTAHASAA